MIRPIQTCLVVAALLCSGLQAQSLQSISTQREQKLEASLQRLRELRAEIEAERLPLARQLQSLDTQATTLEKEAERVQRLRDSKQVELETLRKRVIDRQKEVDFITRSLIPGFIADYDASLAPGEHQTTGESIRSYNLYLEDVDASELSKLDASLKLMREAVEALEQNIGGKRFNGTALTSAGTVSQGSFIQIGPLSYFAAKDGSEAGLILEDSLDTPKVHPIDAKASEAILTIAQNGSGQLPVDVTLGDALAIEQTKDTLSEHLNKGGVWVYPILLFAFVATIAAIYKAIQVFTVRHPQPLVIHDIVKQLRQGQTKEAMALAQAQPEPAREMLTMAVDHADESTEMVEEVMYESMLTTQPKLERFLNLIAVTAAAAPLLGLLGTVTGIIKTFKLMTVFGAGDPKPLISGISEALITTELGLILAIPALVMHAILSRKVAGIMARLEKTAVTFVNGLARSNPQDSAQK